MNKIKLISHRGNYDGIQHEKENKPSYIDTTISMGYDVEVDIRFIDNKYYLGHDTPDTIVSETWIINRKNNIWFHCKDLYTAQQFKKINSDIKYFCHSNDPFVLTSTNHIWVHDLSLTLDNSCIIPLLSKEDIKFNNIFFTETVYAICTDYIKTYKNEHE